MVAARLDAEIVRRGLARSRTRAASLVSEGRVTVDGVLARKPAQAVTESTGIDVAGDVDDDVSRGARKLEGALGEIERLAPGELDLSGRRCLDAGASDYIAKPCCCGAEPTTCSLSTSGTASSPLGSPATPASPPWRA